MQNRWPLIRVGAVLLAWLAVSVTPLAEPGFSVDQWSLYELAGSVADFPSGFYRVNTVRQFEFDTEWGNSFPPAYPVLLAGARAALPTLGIYAAWLLNCALMLGWWPLCRVLATRLGMSAAVGDGLFLTLLFNAALLADVLAGGAMGLFVLLSLALLAEWAEPSSLGTLGDGRALRCGLWAGLAALTRFDALPVGATLLLILAVRVARSGAGSLAQRARPVLLMGLAMGLTMAPWSAYGVIRFGKLLPSDNTRQAASVHPIHVSQFFPPDDPERPTMLPADPVGWARAYISEKLPPLLATLRRELLKNSLVPLLGAGLIVGLIATGRSGWRSLRDDALGWRTIGDWTLATAAQLAAISLTGYSDWRYAGPAVFCVTLALLRALTGLAGLGRAEPIAEPVAEPDTDRARRWLALLVLALAGLVVLQQWRNFAGGWPRAVAEFPHSVPWLRAPRWEPTMLRLEELQPISDELARAELARAEQSSGRRPRVLMAEATPRATAHRFGALSGWPTVPAPINLNAARLPAFLLQYRPTHAYDPNGVLAPMFRARGLSLRPTAVPGLWEIPSDTLDMCIGLPCTHQQ